MSSGEGRRHVVVIGAGFTGLSAGYELARRGIRATVLEKDDAIGGLAGTFQVGGARLERFYHHWYTSDAHVMELIHELGADECVLPRSPGTGMFYANRIYRLTTPLDLLRFKPLSLLGRIRLGLLLLRAGRVKEWRPLEAQTAEEWLKRLCGEQGYRVVWEPLLRGKFGALAAEVSAVWIWNKLKLRGGSRGKGGGEVLAYFRGGFGALLDRMVAVIEEAGGEVRTRCPAQSLAVDDGRVAAVGTPAGQVEADAVIATPALPIIADLVEPHAEPDYAARLRRIQYLANICLVLQLDRRLTDTYWLNVNDVSFPFVGVVSHTNLEPSETYGGTHIVYLSKYLPASDALYSTSPDDYLEFCLPHLQRMFPEFQRSWVQSHNVWRAPYAQPVVVRHYSKLIPAYESPLRGLRLASMAQIYPEDRGTNYAVREGRAAARAVADALCADG